MEEYVEYSVRPGHFGLSLVSLGGLALLGASLWLLMPGFVILILVPALILCAWQLIVTPVYGVRLGQSECSVLDGKTDQKIPYADIAYLRLIRSSAATRATIVLNSGSEVDLPVSMTAEPLTLIRDVTARGVPIRTY